MFSFPEDCKVLEGLAPQVGAAAAVTGRYISLKNAKKAWVVIHYNQADGNAITWHVKRATAVAPTGAIAVTELLRIWSNLDCATLDLLVERTAAINYASGAGTTHKKIIFEVDPSQLADTFDCIAGCSTTAIAAGQYVSMLYVLQPRYASQVSTQPSVITD
jgi:hypothetical protein